jgi:hypothetical protein
MEARPSMLSREELLSRIQELEEENADLVETLDRINELSSDAVESEEASDSEED